MWGALGGGTGGYWGVTGAGNTSRNGRGCPREGGNWILGKGFPPPRGCRALEKPPRECPRAPGGFGQRSQRCRVGFWGVWAESPWTPSLVGPLQLRTFHNPVIPWYFPAHGGCCECQAVPWGTNPSLSPLWSRHLSPLRLGNSHLLPHRQFSRAGCSHKEIPASLISSGASRERLQARGAAALHKQR